ncbi:MAG: hypothetical protein II453_04140 [Alphaproteobacteria bacterium]|nr:hypothetical protein [Alphaproteobacteria bacterium]
MTWLLEHWQDILAFYGGVVLVCSTIIKLTPSTKDDAVWAKIEKVLDMFSVVFTKADAKKLEKAK